MCTETSIENEKLQKSKNTCHGSTMMIDGSALPLQKSISIRRLCLTPYVFLSAITTDRARTPDRLRDDRGTSPPREKGGLSVTNLSVEALHCLSSGKLLKPRAAMGDLLRGIAPSINLCCCRRLRLLLPPLLLPLWWLDSLAGVVG